MLFYRPAPLKRTHDYTFLHGDELSESDSEEVLIKKTKFTPMQSFRLTQAMSLGKSSYELGSDIKITNAQHCKFDKISTETSSEPISSISSNKSKIQQRITDHFTPKESAQRRPTSTITHFSPECGTKHDEEQLHNGTYSLVRSSIALSNL